MSKLFGSRSVKTSKDVNLKPPALQATYYTQKGERKTPWKKNQARRTEVQIVAGPRRESKSGCEWQDDQGGTVSLRETTDVVFMFF